MKIAVQYIAVGILIIAFAGCGGKKTKTIKGIEEREYFQSPAKTREKINPRAYNHFINGSIFEILGEINMANQHYGKALKFYPESDEIRLSYATTFYAMNNYVRAMTEAQKISARNLDTWKLLSDCFGALGKVDSLINAYHQIIRLDSSQLKAFYRLGLFYQEKKVLDSAIWAFEHAAPLSSGYRLYSQLAGLQIKVARYDDAEQSYLKSLEQDSSKNNIQSYLGLAAINEYRNDMDKMKEYLRAAADLVPEDLQIQNRILGFYQRDNQYDLAMEIAKRIQSVAPNDVDNKRRLGLFYLHFDSLNLADSIFTDLINTGDTDMATYYYAGRTSLLKENYNKAIEIFKELTIVADSISDGWLNLGLAYRLTDSLDKEIETYELGLNYMRIRTDSTAIYFAHGVTLERHDKGNKAIEIFEKIIALDPDHSQSLNYLGYMFADLGIELERARELIEDALRIMPESGAYLDSYGWVLFKLGEPRSALDQLLLAYEYVNNDPIIMEHIGDVYNTLGDRDNANHYWEKALEADPDNEDLKEKLTR